MLTPTGKKRGVAAVVEELDGWHKKNLSKYKWLRGGIQVIDAVCSLFRGPRYFFLVTFFLPFFFKKKKLIFLDDASVILRFRNHQRVKLYVEFCRRDMRRMLRR